MSFTNKGNYGHLVMWRSRLDLHRRAPGSGPSNSRPQLTITLDCSGYEEGSSKAMNADAFRYLYDYHFAENHRIWDCYVVPLPYDRFTQGSEYSHGSVRDQIVHLVNVDDIWFSELRGVEILKPFEPTAFDDRESIRTHWDRVEQRMRDYLAGLRDDMLFEKPITAVEEDKNLITWQVLLHVVNHGTDHRAQLLRLLHDLGVKTTSQDFIFYVYDHL
jgi:uncharacterized damage-inducible protein DinB